MVSNSRYFWTIKFIHKVLRCSDGLSSVARELKLVYLTRATSRYQEREDSMFHAPRGRGFFYSGSFAFKDRVVVSCPKGNVWLQFKPREITLF